MGKDTHPSIKPHSIQMRSANDEPLLEPRFVLLPTRNHPDPFSRPRQRSKSASIRIPNRVLPAERSLPHPISPRRQIPKSARNPQILESRNRAGSDCSNLNVFPQRDRGQQERLLSVG